MNERRHAEPMFQAPSVVIGVLLFLIGIHLVRVAGPEWVDQWLINHLAFVPARLSAIGESMPGPAWVGVTSLLTYSGLHGDWTHLIFNGAWLLAFGSFVAKRTGTVNFLALFAVCAVAGALLYWVMNIGAFVVMVGASGAISGLMGAAFRILFSAMDWGGINTLQHEAGLVPRMPLVVALQDRRVLLAIGAWLGINIVFGILVPGVFTEAGIAWEAHIGGFFAGFFLFGFFDRGRGWMAPPSRQAIS